ncbi:MAG: hypothetical protein Q7S31_01415 [bacterium]|nr:hypothetical protein [bacterium]
MAIVRFEYFDPSIRPFMKIVEEIDLDDCSCPPIRKWEYRDPTATLGLKALGVMGLYLKQMGGWTEGQLQKEANMSWTEVEALAQGYVLGHANITQTEALQKIRHLAHVLTKHDDGVGQALSCLHLEIETED